MGDASDVLYEFDTAYGHYLIADMAYDGRAARVLFSGDRQAAQSGLAMDGKDDLLFDYNQRMFELVAGLKPARILLIGGGMFTLPTALLREMPHIRIDVIELDDGLTDVAANYFGLTDDPRLTIINTDGLKYLAATTRRYDMIVLDAYTHASAEPSLETPEAISRFRNHLMPTGLVVANVITAYFGRRSLRLRQLLQEYEQQFATVQVFPASQSLSLWLPQNLLLTAQLQATTPLGDHLRFRCLEPTLQPFELGRDIGA